MLYATILVFHSVFLWWHAVFMTENIFTVHLMAAIIDCHAMVPLVTCSLGPSFYYCCQDLRHIIFINEIIMLSIFMWY